MALTKRSFKQWKIYEACVTGNTQIWPCMVVTLMVMAYWTWCYNQIQQKCTLVKLTLRLHFSTPVWTSHNLADVSIEPVATIVLCGLKDRQTCSKRKKHYLLCEQPIRASGSMILRRRWSHNFCCMASESVVAFSSFSTPQFTCLIKWTSGNFITEIKRENHTGLIGDTPVTIHVFYLKLYMLTLVTCSRMNSELTHMDY